MIYLEFKVQLVLWVFFSFFFLFLSRERQFIDRLEYVCWHRRWLPEKGRSHPSPPSCQAPGGIKDKALDLNRSVQNLAPFLEKKLKIWTAWSCLQCAHCELILNSFNCASKRRNSWSLISLQWDNNADMHWVRSI